jgi:hypothetical protein
VRVITLVDNMCGTPYVQSRLVKRLDSPSKQFMAEWFDLIGKINDEAEGIIDEYDSQIADLEAEGGDPAGLRAYKKAALEALIKKAAGSE